MMPVSRSNLHQSSYLKKILGYREIAAQKLHQSHFGLPNLLVLNVTTSEEHMKNIVALVNELTEGRGSTMFLFKTISTLGDFMAAPAPTAHIVTSPWQRAGCEAFSIHKM
jgi:hypothetical protein